MTEYRIIYPDDTNGISVVIPAPGINHTEALMAVPKGKPYRIIGITDLPNDLTFREAWTADFTNADIKFDMITINLEKAKMISHNIRRKMRENEFEPFDNLIMKQIPGTDFQQVEIQRQSIRDKYADIQIEIDNANNTDSLLNIINSITI